MRTAKRFSLEVYVVHEENDSRRGKENKRQGGGKREPSSSFFSYSILETEYAHSPGRDNCAWRRKKSKKTGDNSGAENFSRIFCFLIIFFLGL